MTQYILKSALVADVKRRIKTNKECMLGLKNLDYYRGKVDALNDTISFLNSIEEKEMDLESEIDRVWDNTSDNFSEDGWKEFEDIAKHFFELGLCSTITEEDCKLIWNIGDEIPYMPEEEFFKELLRRYKIKKGE